MILVVLLASIQLWRAAMQPYGAMALVPPCSVLSSEVSHHRVLGTLHLSSSNHDDWGDDNDKNVDMGEFSLRQYRKQKASDRRTRRMQRGGNPTTLDMERAAATGFPIKDDVNKKTMTISPMQQAGQWGQKRINNNKHYFPTVGSSSSSGGGRGRSRKRSQLYSSLATYQDKFLRLLMDEYRIEVGLV